MMEAQFAGTPLTITKFDAARNQLRTAIELWFSEGDPASIHTLAHASHEIIHRRYRNAGLRDLMYDSSVVKKERRGEFAVMLKDDGNFFKHADNNTKPNDSMEFNTGRSFLFILMSLFAVSRLGHTHTAPEAAFMMWCAINNPHWFPQVAIDQVPQDLFRELREIERRDFLEMFIISYDKYR
jgi:hypothetical protein